jgi:steroid delta-isomerase-like uncharacterized protein
MSVEENEAVVRRYFDEFWDHRNVALAPEIFAADFVFYAPIVPDGIHGVEAYRRSVVEPLLAAFPDLQLVPGEAICQGDRVAMPFTMSGTHRGTFAGIPPTGKRFAVPGVVVGRVIVGRIEELRGVFDGLGMMQQLGVLPAPTPGGR